VAVDLLGGKNVKLPPPPDPGAGTRFRWTVRA